MKPMPRALHRLCRLAEFVLAMVMLPHDGPDPELLACKTPWAPETGRTAGRA
jgi:hypothetical protein